MCLCILFVFSQATTEAVGHLANHQRSASVSVEKYLRNGANDLLVQPLASAESEIKVGVCNMTDRV